MSSGRVPHNRSGDSEASWPEATSPGSRCGKGVFVQVGSDTDFRDGDAGSTEI